jgi:hypothetical protein
VPAGLSDVVAIAAGGHSVAVVGTACGPAAFGDINNDGCVDRGDLAIITAQIRAGSRLWMYDRRYDLNGDGKVDIADARFLVVHFTNPDGSPCPP